MVGAWVKDSAKEVSKQIIFPSFYRDLSLLSVNKKVRSLKLVPLMGCGVNGT